MLTFDLFGECPSNMFALEFDNYLHNHNKDWIRSELNMCCVFKHWMLIKSAVPEISCWCRHIHAWFAALLPVRAQGRVKLYVWSQWIDHQSPTERRELPFRAHCISSPSSGRFGSSNLNWTFAGQWESEKLLSNGVIAAFFLASFGCLAFRAASPLRASFSF